MLCALMAVLCITGCEERPDKGSRQDVATQVVVAANLAVNQPTPTDIDYSLERYNLIRRAYWVNGQREKANALECPLEKPFGYIVLINGESIIGRFVVDGKVSSLNWFLTPSTSEKMYSGGPLSTELADVDGSYGENDSGIFFFTPDGKYVEWTGKYLYTDIPVSIDNPVIKIEAE